MSRPLVRALLPVALLLCTSCGSAPEVVRDEIVIGERQALYSKVLGEERPYWVALPRGYTAGKSAYPVLYLLDGSDNFVMAAGVVDSLSRDRGSRSAIPELIIVGIPNTHRVRDLTPTRSDKDSSGYTLPGHEQSGGAAGFLAFLEQELAPSIDASYRTSGLRLLAGHSYGGLFALYAFLERPGLFQGIAAIDPSLYFDDLVLPRRAERSSGDSWCGSVYLSIADHPDTAEFDTMRAGIARFSERIDGAAPALRAELDFIAGESHESVGLLSLYRGLKFIFMDEPAHGCRAPASAG